MSRENVEIIRRTFEGWDEGNVTVGMSAFHPEVEWQTPDDEPDAGTHQGIEAVASFIQGWADSFESFSPEPQEFIDAGDDVVVPVIMSGRPRGSDHFVTVTVTQVFTVRGRRIVAVREYRTRAEALEAVGGRE